MKGDRLINIFGVLMALTGVMALSVGKFILGGLLLIFALGVFMTNGSGDRNARSLYEKMIDSDISIAELYEKFKDMDTPLGRCWLCRHRKFDGDVIIWGPGIFKDAIIIGRSEKKLDLKMISSFENIISDDSDQWRFDRIMNTAELSVTPKVYSVFASFKLISVRMLEHLRMMIEAVSSGENVNIPASLDEYNLYRHNFSTNEVIDEDDNVLLVSEACSNPFSVVIRDADGEEMARITANKVNKKGVTFDEAGFDMYADGEYYGTFVRGSKQGHDCWTIETESGIFEAVNFMAVRRANISGNYVISLNGEEKAVVAGSNLEFEGSGKVKNNIICSYDDDYVVFYAVFEIFAMTVNNWLK